jgi:putative zinc finger protein
MGTSECSAAQRLMSPFIDSMVTPEEAERLEFHVSHCGPCWRQLQSLISMRSLLARIDRPELPEDLVLETRVKLSHARNTNVLVRLENRLGIILKPIALPALFGVALTMLFFGVLLGSLATNSTVLAQSGIGEQPVFGLYKPVRTTEPTMIRFAVNKNTWTDPLMIETHVGDDGKVIDYRIISGPETPEVNRWVREMLSLAAFTPATAFGRPVESKIILSFVAVRS